MDFFFYTIYNFLKQIQGVYPSQTDSRRALLAIYLIALFVLMNIVSIFQLTLTLELLILSWVILSVVLYFVFIFKRRYILISSIFTENWEKRSVHQVSVLLFVVLTIVLFIVRNPL